MEKATKAGTYVLEHGEVWFDEGTTLPGTRALGMGRRHVCHSSDLIAVVFDTETGNLVRHGRDADVAPWLSARRKKTEASGFPELTDTLVHLAFPPVPEAVEELNACLRQHGRILRLQDALANLPLPPPTGLPRFST